MQDSDGNRQSSRPVSRSTQASDAEQLPASALSNLANVPIRPIGDHQQSAIRLRRIRSRPEASIADNGRKQQQQQQQQQQDRLQAGRRRSSSAPQQARSMLDIGEGSSHAVNPMASVPEISQPYDAQTMDVGPISQSHGDRPRPGLLHRGTQAMLGRRRQSQSQAARQAGSGGGEESAAEYEYDSSIVDILDVVDPEVSTLSSITNVQNSLFIPSLGRFVNRRPTYNLTRLPRIPGAFPASQEDLTGERPASARTEEQQGAPSVERPQSERPPPVRPTITRIPSTMTERFYAVRPHNASLDAWTDEELVELNDHVRHMLHSRRSKMKRSLKAFGQYVRRPLGFLVTLYATLITLFGLAWVLFLIGWIYVGSKQLYVINVIDNVLVALFAIVGDGLIPWRIVDTYHMCYIAHYHHLTWHLRNKLDLPHLEDKNDLPPAPASLTMDEIDLEDGGNQEDMVLTPQQQRKLEHHQAKFCKSHTFYKPHETETHYAFPQRLLVAIVVLLDCHSCFQLALGLCTWCIDYRTRPMALTATILSCSIAVNITAGILISIGDRRTRKKDVIERMFRQELTQEAMKRVNKAKAKETMGLDKIEEEEKDTTRNSLNIQFPRPKLDFLKRSSSHTSKARDSSEASRKSLDRLGRFDPSVGETRKAGQDDPRAIGAFPEE